MMSTRLKRCGKCEQHKPLGDFYDQPGRKEGKGSQCKLCTLAYNRNRYHNVTGVRERNLERDKYLRRTDSSFRDRTREYGRKYYASLAGRARTLHRGALRRQPGASLTLEHIHRLLEIGSCPITGLKFDFTGGTRAQGRHNNPFAPSIDKIIPALGYTDANTRLVIWQYNWMKGELSDDEIFLLCFAVVNHHG